MVIRMYYHPFETGDARVQEYTLSLSLSVSIGKSIEGLRRSRKNIANFRLQKYRGAALCEMIKNKALI